MKPAPLPDLGFGIGLRARHAAEIVQSKPNLGFFEIISENYLDNGGRPLQLLDEIAEHYPIVMHGVSLSIGSADPLDFAYLQKLKSLARRVNAAWISDHVCFTGVAGINTHDLLPIPYTEEMLAHVVERVRVVQDVLERPLVLENPSTYAAFTASTLTEEDFLTQLCAQTECRLLLDVNNAYVCAFNHGFDAPAYVDAIPAERVVQVHLAGHSDKGAYLLDTHDGPVIDPVWALYARLLARTGPIATLLEWDANIPALETIVTEARKAETFRNEHGSQGGPLAHAL